MKTQFGRSMVEMLGVLAIIGVLSIGGLLGYRRAVNNQQANQILDDVNRFAFVILERSGLPQGDVVPKGDFKESGPYTLEGYQDIEPNQFSITVTNVPKGVCEALLPKAAVEYALRVNEHGEGDGPLYDAKHQDLCNGSNDIVLYFGDTSDLCYPADIAAGETRCNDCRCDGYCVVDSVTGEDVCCPAGQKAVGGVCTAAATGQACTTNANCTAGEFCLLSSTTEGTCTNIGNDIQRITLSNGQTWVRALTPMKWRSAENWCEAQKLKQAERSDLNCSYSPCANRTCCSSDIITALQTEEWRLNNWVEPKQWHWLMDSYSTGMAYTMNLYSTQVSADGRQYEYNPLCIAQ